MFCVRPSLEAGSRCRSELKWQSWSYGSRAGKSRKLQWDRVEEQPLSSSHS